MDYRELPLTNSFMFYKIMRNNKDACKGFIERLLGIELKDIEYLNGEQELEFDYDSKGVRLDVYVKNSDKVFNIELQTYQEPELGKRMRYYQSMIDIDNLNAGQNFHEMKDSFILFVTNHDYFGKKLPCYTFKTRCLEDPSICLNDKAIKVVYNFMEYKKDTDENRKSLLEFLCTKQTSDDFTQSLNNLVDEAHKNEKWRMQFMTLEMIKEDEFRMGMEKGYSSGVADGSHDKAVETARKMLDKNIDIKTISEITDLSVEEISNLIK